MNTIQKKTILLVEDEIIIALASAETIKSLGYEVLLAHSGEDAVQIVTSNPNINMILMDIDLGRNIDGTRAAEIILQTKEVPVVFLSSRTEPEILKRTEKVTSYGYIVKGSSLTILSASITMAFKLFETNQNLKLTKNKLEATLNALPDLLLEVDGETKCFDYHAPNPNHFLIENQEGIIGRKLIDILPAHAAEIMHLSLEEAKQKGYSHGKQFGLTVFEEESYFELSVSRKINNGTDERFIILSRDITDRKIAEKSLLESEELLSITLHSIGDAVIATDVSGSITRMNRTAERLTGWTFLEAKGKSLAEIFHIINANTRTKVNNPVAKVLETGEIIGLANHTILISKDEKEYQIADSAAPILDNAGNMKGVILVFSDVTEKYKADEKIRRNETKFRTIIEASPIPFALNDENKNITYLNSAFINSFGYTTDEIPTLEDWWPKAYPDKTYRDWVMNTWQIHLEEAKKTGDPFKPIELNIVCKTGIVKTVIASAVSLQANFEDVHLVVLYDITERKAGEIKLKENQMLYESLVDILPHNLYRIDLEGHITYINKTLLKNFNIPLADILGKTAYDFYPLELANKYTKDDKKVIETGETLFLIEDNISPVTGEVSSVEVIKTPTLDANGKINGLQGVFWDITEKRKAEEEIKSLLAEKEMILKEVHHRIKNNMATILGFLTLQAEASKEPSAATALKDAESRVQTMMILYDKLYNSANYSDISIKEYLTTLIQQIVWNFPNANAVKIETKLEDFIIDSRRSSAIGIILNELITNTMKYAFDEKTNGLIKISTQVKEEKAVLEISDNGKGLPESISIENSTGFGLILVGMLAKQLNGKIKFENENGTKIVLEFKI